MGTTGLKLPSRSAFDMKELIGKKLGTRKIIARGENSKSGNHTVVVECDCGNIATIETARFLAGRHKTCLNCAKKNQTGNNSHSWKGGRHISLTVYNFWKKNAIRRKIIWDLSVEYLDALLESQNFRCIFTGDKLTIGHGNGNGLIVNGSASLDRIDSSLGYIYGNVQFVIKPVNLAKQALSDSDFIELCRKIVNYADR